MGTAAEWLMVQRARDALKAGKRLRVSVGTSPEDPVLLVWLDDAVVMCAAVAGWSAGVVEPVCFVGSDYLAEFLGDKRSVGVLTDDEAAALAGWAI